MQITKTSVIDFDERAERARIERTWTGAKREGVRQWLLTVLDSFEAGDFDAACKKLQERPRGGDEDALEYLNSTVYHVLVGYSKAKNSPRTSFTINTSSPASPAHEPA